jgi:multiple sugar transport system ATP-binding protein
MATVRYHGVRKDFDRSEIIRGVDLDIADGEFVVFVGPSGCGKTTLLRLLAGLEHLTSGDIFIGRRNVSEVPARDRNIAMVFQNYALYPHMTVAENIGFGLKLRGMARADREARIRDAASLLGLGELLDRKPRALSGGQRQRVAMGRAIVRDPDVFLMDEPLSNLDAQLRTQMRADIRDLQSHLGTTTIYVTHDQVEAITMADRIVVIRDGVVQQFGSPAELYDRPANRFVAGFIGSPAMNFLNLRRDGAARFTTETGCGLPVDGPLKARLDKVESCLLGLRPRDLSLVNGTTPPVAWHASVRLVEPLGGESLVHVDLSGQPLTLRVDGVPGLRPGEEVSVGFDPARTPVHLFDAATEQRIA